MRCAAPLHLYDIAIFNTKNIFSRIMTDDGQTTQGKPLRHITPGQENILKYRRILSIEEKPSYSWTFWLNWWYAPSRWFLRRKNISQREENVLGRIYPQLHIRSQKWNEKWRKKWKPFFFPVKKKTFYEIKNIADFVHFLSRRPTRKKKHSV